MNRINKILALGVFFVAIGGWLLYPARGVPILAYHQVAAADDIYNIDPRDFEAQMSYLAANGYTAISLADMFAAGRGEKALPAKPVIITFDDGYEDNYLTALPIMEKYGMRGTVFVIASLVGQPEYLNWDEIRDLRDHRTEIGSHTLTHMALDILPAADMERELAESRAMIEQGTGTPVRFLAYPYGQFSPAVFRALRNTGYDGACTGRCGLNKPGGSDNPYALKRINIPRPRAGLLEFRLRLLRANIYSWLGW